jgi:hypothetical protein
LLYDVELAGGHGPISLYVIESIRDGRQPRPIAQG